MTDKTFEKGFKVGDAVVGYHRGYYEITKIEHRFLTADDLRWSPSRTKGKQVGDEHSSLVHYKRIAKENGIPVKNSRSTKHCDEAYLVYTKEWIKGEIKRQEQKLTDLKELEKVL